MNQLHFYNETASPVEIMMISIWHLLGMPITSTMGLGGAPKKGMIAPWIINRNGQ